MSTHPGDKPVLRFVAQFFGLGAIVLFGVLAWILVSISDVFRPDVAETAGASQAADRAALLKKVRKEQSAAVSQASWIDEKAGIARIPVSKAKELVLADLKKKAPKASTAPVPGAAPAPAPAPAPEKEAEKPKADTEPKKPADTAKPKEAEAAKPAPKADAEPKEMPKETPKAEEKPADKPKEDAKAKPADASAEVPPADPALLADGATVYNSYCIACHGPDAKANMVPGMAPSLVGSEILVGPTERAAMTLLHGITPEARFTGVMVAWKDILNDRQIAGVISYVRSNFGNSASPVTPEQVAWARKKYEGKTDQFKRSDIEATKSNLPYPVPQ